MNPLDKPLLVTTFRDKFARTKKEHTKSLRQIAPAIQKRSAPQKAALPWLKLAGFGDLTTGPGCLRNDANVEAIYGIEVDYDGEKIPMLEPVQRFQKIGIALLGYTSPSHTPAKPRWRLLFPLSARLPPSERRRLVARVNGVLGGVLRGVSFALSQSYYWGSVNDNPYHKVVLADEQRYLDQADELDAGAIDPPDGSELEGEPRKEPDTTRNGDATKVMGKIARDGGTKEDARAAIDSDDRLAEWAAGKKGQRQFDRTWEYVTRDWPADLKGFGLNEDDMAQAFTARHSGELRYCREVRRWHVWTGTHWRHEKKALAFHWARLICRELRRKNADDPMAAALAKARTAEQIEKFAQADPLLAVDVEIWDRDPWLLGTPAGTVDLRTGELRAARQEDFITKLAAVGPPPGFDPAFHIPHCPLWLRFLVELTGGDAGVIRFLKQFCGYSLTGLTIEEALLFLFGLGGNGKSVFLNTIVGILGDYAHPHSLSNLVDRR